MIWWADSPDREDASVGIGPLVPDRIEPRDAKQPGFAASIGYFRRTATYRAYLIRDTGENMRMTMSPDELHLAYRQRFHVIGSSRLRDLVIAVWVTIRSFHRYIILLTGRS